MDASLAAVDAAALDAAALKAKFTPKETRVLDLDRQVTRARFSPAGDLLAAADYDGAARRWKVVGEEFTELPRLVGHSGWLTALAFSPAGDLLYTVDSWGKLCAWPAGEENPAPRWHVAQAHDGWIRGLAVSPSGEWLATCGRDRRARLWNAANGQLARELPEQPLEQYCVAFHPGGEFLATSDLKGRVRQWRVATGEPPREFDATALHHHERIQDVCGARVLAFDPAGKTLIVAGGKPTGISNLLGVPTLLLFDWESGQLRATRKQAEGVEGFVFDLSFHPAGFFVTAVSGQPGQGRVFFQRLEDDKPFYAHDKLSNVFSAAPHPAGELLVVSSTNRDSQGNGKVVDKNGNYVGNRSPLTVLKLG